MANIFYVKCMVILHYLGNCHLVVNHISFKYMHICTRVIHAQLAGVVNYVGAMHIHVHVQPLYC